MLGGLIPPSTLAYFRIGEGGWVYNPALLQRERRIPDPDLTNLDIILDAGRPALTRRYDVGESAGYFQKTLTPADISAEGPGILRIGALLDNPEANLETDLVLVYDNGGPYVGPEFWEIGVFDTDDVMVLYGTFPRETKDAARQVENVVRFVTL